MSSHLPQLRSLNIDAQGRPLVLRLLLPPNLAAVVARGGRIAVKVEWWAGSVNRGNEPLAPDQLKAGPWLPEPPAFFAALLIESWCEGRLPGVLQLDADQLSQLLQPLEGSAAVYWLKAPQTPIPWRGGELEGVHSHLRRSPEGSGAKLAPSSGKEAASIAAAADADGTAAPQMPQLPQIPQMEPELMPLELDGSLNFLAIRLPSRQSALYPHALDLVRDWGFKLEPSNAKWWLRDRHKTLQFLADCGELLRTHYCARFSDNFTERSRGLRVAQIALDVSPSAPRSSDAFEVELSIRAPGVDEQALQQAFDKGQHYVELPQGGRSATAGQTVVLVPRALRERVLEVQQTLGAGSTAAAGRGLRARFGKRVLKEEVAVTQGALQRLQAVPVAVPGGADGAAAPASQRRGKGGSRAAAASASFGEAQWLDGEEEMLAGARLPQQWLELSRALADVSQLQPCPLPSQLAAQLRPYQRVGAAWLWHLFRSGLGGILADEMGLGKTVQCLAFLGAVQASQKSAAPSLVVCPAALVENWRREALRFMPQLRVFCHHGSSRLADADEASAYDLVLTSYGTLTRDQALLQQVPFCVIVGDEAQHIKNAKTRNARALRSLRSQGRFLLTGTPIENDISELQSLFDFILPGYLARAGGGGAGSGGDTFAAVPDRSVEHERLITRAAPYILRRMKQSVAAELPQKIEQVLYCELEADQQAFYRQVQETARRAVMELELGGAAQGRLRMAAFTELLRLRQACIDPRLVGNAAVAEVAQISSAKREALRELLQEAADGGHRVLVFSQFTAALQLVAEDLQELGLTHFYLDGQTKNRTELCERFNRDASVKVFLISLRAGGTGLNLTGADTVVHLDPWWNPAAQAQATDRAHRIGQTRVVNVYQLIAAGTVEEKVLGLQRHKAALLEQLLDASDAASAKIGLDDLKELIA